MAYTPYMTDYGSLPDVGAGLGGGTQGLSMSELGPYLQALLGVYGATRGSSGTQALADKFSQMSPGADLPDQPSSQSKTNRALRAGGQAALNFVPVVGGALSAVGGAYNADVDARAKQAYLQRLLSSNPGIVDPQGIGLRSEYVPQTNMAARYAQSQPKFTQNVIEKRLLPKTEKVYNAAGPAGKFAKNTDVLYRLGKGVIGSKSRQREKEQEIAHENMRKAKSAEESQRVTAQDMMARKRTAQATAGNANQAQVGAQQAILQQILAPQGWEALGKGFSSPYAHVPAYNMRGY